MRGKCSRLTAVLDPVHVEGHVFFSCLASLSGFLKDAKSVYLKRLLACVKRRLMLYIRLLFYFTLGLFVRLFSYSVFFLISHELQTGTHVLFLH